MPIEKLNGLVLSELFFSIGTAYERDIGPIAVIKSKEAIGYYIRNRQSD